MSGHLDVLPLWIDFFNDLQHIRGRSENTIMAYRRDLELYVEYRKKAKKVSGFYDFMRSKKLSQRSQARVISSLRTYFKYCENNGKKSSELRELKPPKVKVGLPQPLTVEEFDQLFHAAQNKDAAKTARNQITLLMLFGLGCRVSELIELSLNDYSETEKWLKVLGKGKKERLIPLTDALNEELKIYIESVRPLLTKDRSGAILVNDKGHRPSRVDIWRWLASWSAKAGFDEPVHPHRFRHGCATALLEAGADLRSIQILLGHSSINTTQIYTSVTTQNLIQTVDRHHPLADLDDI